MLNVSALVKQDLIDVWLYTFNEWGEVQADNYLDGLEDALKLLAEQPLICRERQEFTPPVRIYHYEYHLVVYQLNGEGINIIRVLHNSMDAPQHLDQ